MYENHRKSFDRNDYRSRDDNRDRDDQWSDNRWRGNDRGWGDERRGGYDQDDWRAQDEWRGRNREFGYASAFRDDDFGRYGGGYGSQRDRGSDFRQQQDHGHWAHDAQHRHGAGASHYGASQRGQFGGDGNSRYFTGTQGSYAVDTPYDRRTGAVGYYGAGYGSDYREHGYTGRRGDGDRGFWDRASDEVASWFGDEDAARRREQDHRGRGPKDYTRSDERIREDANDRLTDDPRVDASSVTISVKDGEITLNGTVPSREEKRRAEDCVDRISGVKHVQNNLRVNTAASTTGDYASNWTTNRTSTAEGGTISQGAAATGADRQTNKA